MIRELACSVAWILGGSALAGGIFWALINTPESTIVALAVSLLLVVALIVTVGMTVCGALAGWQSGWRGTFLRSTLTGMASFVPTLVVAGVAWWAVGRGLTWLEAHGGEISAWFIATANWSDVSPLLRTARIGAEWLRWVAIPFAGMVWLSGALPGRARPIRSWAALARGGWLTGLAAATAIALLTIWAPVAYGLYWRPSLPPTWLEPAAAVVKLGVIGFSAAIGLSLIARLAVQSGSIADHRS